MSSKAIGWVYIALVLGSVVSVVVNYHQGSAFGIGLGVLLIVLNGSLGVMWLARHYRSRHGTAKNPGDDDCRPSEGAADEDGA